jgi:hypothetical protein
MHHIPDFLREMRALDPEVKIPKLRAPEVQIPNLQVPEVQIPKLHK